jgi:hypothetical protein
VDEVALTVVLQLGAFSIRAFVIEDRQNQRAAQLGPSLPRNEELGSYIDWTSKFFEAIKREVTAADCQVRGTG